MFGRALADDNLNGSDAPDDQTRRASVVGWRTGNVGDAVPPVSARGLRADAIHPLWRSNMAQHQRRFVMIRPGLDASRGDGTGGGGEALAGYLVALSKSLVGLGHEVEIWTVQCDDEPATGRTGDGVTIRRFPGRRDYTVPRLRPCAWVSEWVACATAHLTGSPGGDD